MTLIVLPWPWTPKKQFEPRHWKTLPTHIQSTKVQRSALSDQGIYFLKMAWGPFSVIWTMLIWVYAARLSLAFFSFMHRIMRKIPITYMNMRTMTAQVNLYVSAVLTRRIVGCIAGYCEICQCAFALSDQGLCWSHMVYSLYFYVSRAIGKGPMTTKVLNSLPICEVLSGSNRRIRALIRVFTVRMEKRTISLFEPRWFSRMRARLVIRRSRVRSPPAPATFFRGDWSWNIF